MVHVIEPLAVEASYDVHYVFEDYSAMEGPRLRRVADCLDLGEPSLINIKLMDIVESLLVCVHASKDVDVAPTYHG